MRVERGRGGAALTLALLAVFTSLCTLAAILKGEKWAAWCLCAVTFFLAVVA